MTYTVKPQSGQGTTQTYKGISDIVVSQHDGVCYLVLISARRRQPNIWIPADDYYLVDEYDNWIYATGHEKGVVNHP